MGSPVLPNSLMGSRGRSSGRPQPCHVRAPPGFRWNRTVANEPRHWRCRTEAVNAGKRTLPRMRTEAIKIFDTAAAFTENEPNTCSSTPPAHRYIFFIVSCGPANHVHTTAIELQLCSFYSPAHWRRPYWVAF
jgi:hypothetical protein